MRLVTEATASEGLVLNGKVLRAIIPRTGAIRTDTNLLFQSPSDLRV